jgi:hypothetical protein
LTVLRQALLSLHDELAGGAAVRDARPAAVAAADASAIGLLLFVLPCLLCVGQRTGSEKQGQDCGADDFNWFHGLLPLLPPKAGGVKEVSRLVHRMDKCEDNNRSRAFAFDRRDTHT